jgi:glycosyltransferase involved in cell wall biosynthesis
VEVTLVLTAWSPDGTLPIFWQSILRECDRRGLNTNVIGAVVHPLITQEQPPAARRAFLPSRDLVRALIASPAPVFICIEYSVATALCVFLACLRRRRTIIFQEHRGRGGLRLSLWEKAYRRMLASLSDAIIANTDGAFSELVNDLHVDSKRIFRATILVPPERAALMQNDVRVPDPRHRPVFLFVGKLQRLKNVDGLLRAAATLHARGLNFEVWIVGDGPERNKLENDHLDLVREGRVRFLGSWRPTTVGSLYEAADIFIMPSFRDYRSVAVLEALRFGTPVIDSMLDGNAGDLVLNEITGLIFDPYDPDGLRTAMERAIVEPAALRGFARNALSIMEDQTPRTAAAALCDIVRVVRGR